MILYLRLLRVMLAAVFGRRQAPLQPSVLTFRVWPHDVDNNLHLNNSRYLAMMDLGRMDLIVRCGVGRQMAIRKWAVILASTTIRFRRGLKPFQRFELVTRFVGWDEKWIYLEQQFRRDGELMAGALAKGLFQAPEGNVPTREVLRSVNFRRRAPVLPRAVRQWRAAERWLFREGRRKAAKRRAGLR